MSFSVIYRGEYDIGNRRTRYGKFDTKAEAEHVAKELRKGGLRNVKIVRD